ncbi:MAG: hypothetical protein ACOCWJ_03020 [Verrucomicrobiota bacterium]
MSFLFLEFAQNISKYTVVLVVRIQYPVPVGDGNGANGLIGLDCSALSSILTNDRIVSATVRNRRVRIVSKELYDNNFPEKIAN